MILNLRGIGIQVCRDILYVFWYLMPVWSKKRFFEGLASIEVWWPQLCQSLKCYKSVCILNLSNRIVCPENFWCPSPFLSFTKISLSYFYPILISEQCFQISRDLVPKRRFRQSCRFTKILLHSKEFYAINLGIKTFSIFTYRHLVYRLESDSTITNVLLSPSCSLKYIISLHLINNHTILPPSSTLPKQS